MYKQGAGFGCDSSVGRFAGPWPPQSDDAQTRAWVTALACQKPKDLGYAQELWTTRLLAKHVQKYCETAGHRV